MSVRLTENNCLPAILTNIEFVSIGDRMIILPGSLIHLMWKGNNGDVPFGLCASKLFRLLSYLRDRSTIA